MRIGSLFTGYGGLDLAVEEALSAETVWTSDIDPGASKIIAHRWPHAPNLGDLTQIDWASVEPVDIITGGFPCQDLSHAGKRAGLHDGTRSGLWSHMAKAVEIIRPRLVVAENVRGLLSADAASDLEPCPWCVGDTPQSGVLRALGCVLGDLADIGYDAQWVGLRAADVGAPHGRFRVFVVATDTQSEPWSIRHGDDVRPRRGTFGREQDSGRGAATDADRLGRERDGFARGRRPGSQDVGLTTADASSDGRNERRTEPARVLRGLHAAVSGDAPAADARGERHGRGEDGRGLGLVDGDAAGEARERERSREVAGDRGSTVAANTDGNGQPRLGRVERVKRDSDGRGCEDVTRVEAEPTAWGNYETAIRRWEASTGRTAPAPTETSAKGSQRLSPRFVEWMMGLPAGWVTDVPGLNRNAQLKALGNGVVPQQAAAALTHLLASQAVAT